MVSDSLLSLALLSEVLALFSTYALSHHHVVIHLHGRTCQQAPALLVKAAWELYGAS